MGFDKTHIRWNAVARPQNNDIPRHQLAGGQGFVFTVALYPRVAGEHVADPLQRFFGVALLHVANQGVNDRDAEDNQGIDPVPHHRRQRRRGQQDENQHIVKVGEETQPGRLAFLFR